MWNNVMKDENVCQDVYYLQSPHTYATVLCIANYDEDDDVDRWRNSI